MTTGRDERDETATADGPTTADGHVAIVGAGPGDPELLTVKARRLLTTADLVLYDRLVGDAILESLPPAVTEYVGKKPDGKHTPQERINRRMVEGARAGKQVVRLKGGDPTVFGRGGEELEYLAEHDVPAEVVPGISATVAAPEVVGIPLTHREHAASLTIVTGHENPEKPESALDWSSLADTVTAGGTLVIVMGVKRLPDNVAALRRNGVPADMPAAMVERATLPEQTVITGTLETITEQAREAGIEPPATTVVGDVVSVREQVAELLGAGESEAEGTIPEPEPQQPADAGVHQS